jgi:hypothetical protein
VKAVQRRSERGIRENTEQTAFAPIHLEKVNAKCLDKQNLAEASEDGFPSGTWVAELRAKTVEHRAERQRHRDLTGLDADERWQGAAREVHHLLAEVEPSRGDLGLWTRPATDPSARSDDTVIPIPRTLPRLTVPSRTWCGSARPEWDAPPDPSSPNQPLEIRA